jgi:hypothetical protein
MLIHFKTKAYATITLFGDVALKLIQMMGHSGTVPSAIMAEDVPAALANLKAAVALHRDVPNQQDDDQYVSLAHRALPLIELLSAAAAQHEHVMWDN